jgi:DNA-binding NarL/FixJ family response regulator
MAMGKISLIIVDDHPMFLAGLQQLFKKQPDFEVIGVAEGVAQLETLLQQEAPALILMDIEMPEGDGISATASVRKHSPATKVVILTGYDNPDLIFRALKAGAVGYLLKNSRPRDILDTLRKVAAGEIFLNPELAGKFLREFQRDQELEEVRRLVQTLTPREEEVLRLVATGATNREISQRLFISELTVKMHLASIFRKLQVNDRTKAAILALKAGLGQL